MFAAPAEAAVTSAEASAGTGAATGVAKMVVRNAANVLVSTVVELSFILNNWQSDVTLRGIVDRSKRTKNRRAQMAVPRSERTGKIESAGYSLYSAFTMSRMM